MSEKTVPNAVADAMEATANSQGPADVKMDLAANNSIEAKAEVPASAGGNEEIKDGSRSGVPNSSLAAQAGTVVSPASIAAQKAALQDLAKFSPGDKTNVKFALLIGLIEIGQVSNKEVVNTVLQLVRL
ncbi:Neurobeachin [Orchesella cincta]|uniref:Neurobeachin n=1 Tax=Orchesella cincta TaxID=48709 RepID=A0A1D2NB42_ORCCI|nr:Neurobeachin [Orchesella cincta]